MDIMIAPYARSLGPEQRVRAISELGRRFRPWGWAALHGFVLGVPVMDRSPRAISFWPGS